MSAKSRIFGCIFLVGLAIGGAQATAALAKYDALAATTTLTGQAYGSQVFNTKFGEVKCNAVTFSGTKLGTEVGFGVYTSTSLTLHPQYSECKALGFNATLTTTGCDYVLGSATGTAENNSHAPLQIQCGAGQEIKVVAAGGLCSINIPAQTGPGLVDLYSIIPLTNTGEFRVSSTLNKIQYTGVGGFCSGKGEEGTLAGEVLVKGSSGGSQVGVWVT